MKKEKFLKFISGVLLLIVIVGSVSSVQASRQQQDDGPPVVISSESEEMTPYFTLVTDTYSDGSTATSAIINGPPEPPEGYDLGLVPEDEVLGEDRATLSGFPSYDWVFGCSAVSAGMIAGYYDRHGFPKMYTGPTNGGVMPLTDTSWPKWYSPDYDTHDPYPNNPLIASHKGVDGRTIKGSIDDYWWAYVSTKKDPYILGSWTQHGYATAIGDYMHTSQSKYSLVDGASRFHWNYPSGAKLTCADMVSKGYTDEATLGIKAFYQKRGYTVTGCYSQMVDTYLSSNGYSGGFTLANYKAQINAGNPVLLNVWGHTMVGYGYGTGNTIYIRNTWDNNPSNVYSMQWGGYYSGMVHYQVVVVNLKKPYIPTPLLPSAVTTTHKPTYKWSKVPNATYYNIQLYNFNGTKLLWKPVISSKACGSTTCQFTPPNQFLGDGNYKWRVRAKVGGLWKTFSTYKAFNVATDFHYYFNTASDLKLWRPIVGKWTLNNGWYLSSGVKPYWNSTSHIGYYPKFKYIVRLKRINNPNNSNRIIVRGIPHPLSSDKNWYSYYSFQYTNAGSFSVWKRVNGTPTILKGWSPISAINKYGWNTLKVIGVGSTLKFYINNKLVWSGSDTSLFTGRVGIGFYKPDSSWQPLLVDGAHIYTSFTTSSDRDVWAEMGETNTVWDNEFESPPVP